MCECDYIPRPEFPDLGIDDCDYCVREINKTCPYGIYDETVIDFDLCGVGSKESEMDLIKREYEIEGIKYTVSMTEETLNGIEEMAKWAPVSMSQGGYTEKE